MKKIATRLLSLFSFALLFTAIYLNIAQHTPAAAFLSKTEKKTTLSSTGLANSGAVAQPENIAVTK